MLRTVIRFFLTIIGFICGFELFRVAVSSPIIATGFPFLLPSGIWFSALGGTIFGLIFYFITPTVADSFSKFATWSDGKLKTIPTRDIVLGVCGLLIALLIGVLLNFPLGRIPWVGPYLSPLVTLLLAYLGVTFILNRKDEFSFLTNHFMKRSVMHVGRRAGSGKVLDTSVIIDGRILDISKTGFLEGEILVPGFILEELRHIADSPDLLKRNRGRRGLDILNKMQKELDIKISIINKDYDEIVEVDSKLVKLAQDDGYAILTNDFNLNKVCELQGVSVLNINELANAVKPVVLPGEEMQAHIIKDGKEIGQGVAYLDDGTMIVVEGGRRFIGDTIEVLVTSVLQTAAGRMIFAKPKLAYTEKITT
ncbi:MAG TPA: PIN/TRAM domain-containing protein [Firmicutes bacterium]|jgi:uncharacterized protein YacL|nr:PIN/TRAM domain-containing protein [Bacillota bacterium]